ncbi:hypothetical protein THRCLA_10975 [Thraustotheca clavata]|uniref:SCP domain-containing protein n=1 Tax=Thraustotheca clavata TaxID=74557 RepID=A0A1V9YBX4_9STRA|nr:hypothetical protein THRCLA_10975 [Thraustotheca clavata]
MRFALLLAVVTGAAQVATSDIVKQLFDLHNQERQKNGIAPLTCLDSQLSQLSSNHVKYEVQIDDINHDGFSQRYNAVDAAKFTKSWMDSPGHRENILHPLYTHVGFAVQKGPSGNGFNCSFYQFLLMQTNTCGSPTPTPSRTHIQTTAPTTAKPHPTTAKPLPTTIKTTKRPAPPTSTPIPYTKKPTTNPTTKPTVQPTPNPTNAPNLQQ